MSELWIVQGPSLARLPIVPLANVASFLSLYDCNTLASCSRRLRSTLRAINPAVAPLATLAALIHDSLVKLPDTDDPYLSQTVRARDGLCAALSARLLGPGVPTVDLPVAWRYSYYSDNRLSYAGEKQFVEREMVDVPLDDSRILRLANASCYDLSGSLGASDYREFASIARSSFFAYIVGEEEEYFSWIYLINNEGEPEDDLNPFFRLISNLGDASSKFGVLECKMAEYLHRAFPECTGDLKYLDIDLNWVLPPRLPDDIPRPLLEENTSVIFSLECELDDDVYCNDFPRLLDFSPDLDRAIDALMVCQDVDVQTWQKLSSQVTLLSARTTWCEFPLHLAHCLSAAQNSMSRAADVQPPSEGRPAPGFLRDSKDFNAVRWARRHLELHPYWTVEVPGQLRRSDVIWNIATTLDRSSRLEMFCSIYGHSCDVFGCTFLGEVLNWHGPLPNDAETGILKFGIFHDGIALIESGLVTRIACSHKDSSAAESP
ncbi:hypothetical protein HKX48_000880 [Thoreauomyces humboldtii]|nr:hypothetical protein HKX48_000880 [Thoreauomyces humboldtii]